MIERHSAIQTLSGATKAGRFCGLFDCGDDAVWGIYLQGETRPILVLCDRCRQEWERCQTAYITPDGWDWDDDEVLFPLMAPS